MQVVTVSFLVLLAAFMFGNRDAAREAVGLLPMGAVLAGRMLAPRVIQARLAPALAAVLACFGLSLASQVTGPALPSPDQPLASWLAAHHLTYGLSGIWYASNGITLYSHDHVRVRDVKLSPGSELTRRPWNTQASWYDPQLHNARFVILNPCKPTPTGPLFKAAGRPAATYLADGFIVLVWHTNLLTTHPGPATLPAREPARQRGQPDQIPTSSRKSTAYQLMCG